MLCIHSRHVYEVTVLVLGLDNAGKTTFLANLLHEPASCVVPTIGYRNVKYKYKRAHITLVDLGGGPSIRSIWSNYYAEAHAAIYILDASDTERLEESRRVFLEMSQHPLMLAKPMLVFGNKQDKMEPGVANDIEQILGLRDLNSSSASHRSDTHSMDNLSAELALAYNSQGGSLDDVINTPNSNTHVVKSTLHVSTPNLGEYSSPVPGAAGKAMVRFRYCSAINQRKEMRIKVILKSISWLLRCVRSNWNVLEMRVCIDTEAQKERELRERRERTEQVRLIREKREREQQGEQGNRPHSANTANPFLPIARAVEKAESREQTVTTIQVIATDEREDMPPPDSEEAVAVIAQYFQDASEKINKNYTILGMEKSVYVQHVSSDPMIHSNHINSEEFLRMRYPLDTIHEGVSSQSHPKRRGRNRVAPLDSNSLGPLRSSPGSPPSSILQTFQKSAHRQVSEVYPLIPSNPWCRPFSPVSENSVEEEREKFNEREMQSRSLPDISDCTD